MKLTRILKTVGLVTTAIATISLTGCAVTPRPGMTDQDIGSILIVPPVNESNQVGSELLLLSGMSYPIAERGYYVFPVDTVKMVLESEGLYEPERVQQMNPEELCKLFSSDSVLFVKILTWDAKYVFLSTATTVEAQYTLYKADGQKVFEDTFVSVMDTQGGGSGLTGLIAKAIMATVQRAKPNYRVPADIVNMSVVQRWVPGPYDPSRAKQ